MRHGARVPVMRYGLGSLGSVQSTPRIMRGPAFRGHGLIDVPLDDRDLGDDIEIEMPAECMRRGEIMRPDGTCGPDTRSPIDPYASSPTTVRVPISSTKAAASAAASPAGGMSTTKLLVIGGLAIAAIYFLGRR